MYTEFHFFWSAKSPFSNWRKSKFVIDGIEYGCTEQHMMHQKALLFWDTETAKLILETNEPYEQKRLGRLVKNFDKALWDSKCKEIVYEGNKQKFLQNEDLKEQLFATKGTLLVEVICS